MPQFILTSLLTISNVIKSSSGIPLYSFANFNALPAFNLPDPNLPINSELTSSILSDDNNNISLTCSAVNLPGNAETINAATPVT